MRKNNYIEQLRRNQEKAKGRQEAEAPKPPNQMSEAELDAEVARLEREVRASKERTVELGREEVAGVPRGTVEQVLGHLGGLAGELGEPLGGSDEAA